MKQMAYSGLTSSEANTLLGKNGPNEIPEKRVSVVRGLLKWFISPIALMLLAASLLSLWSGRVFDFYFILGLMVLNALIGFWQENKADNAIKKLNEHLVSQVRVRRDGTWQEVNSRLLVPGDLVEVNVGGVVPADGEIIVSKNLSLNESVLTGESLPKDKKLGDTTYSGAYVSTGLVRLKVTATGENTYFGKTLFSVGRTRKKSELERDILRISKFLSFLSFLAVVIITAVFVLQKTPLTDILTLDLSLVIAGIPISLPTVMTLIIELGVIELAKKQVIVRRLSALEDLANVNLLLTDKTGTLTKNEISVNSIKTYGGVEKGRLVSLSALVGLSDERNVINQALLRKASELSLTVNKTALVDFTPADSERKRGSAVINFHGQLLTVSVGAPQVIESLCAGTLSQIKDTFHRDIEQAARAGFRTLAVAQATGREEKNMRLLGTLTLSDTLREDAKEVIDFMRQNSIEVVMLTGDNRAVSRQVANQLGFSDKKIMTRSDLQFGWDSLDKNVLDEVGVFAEILPDDKYQLVKFAKHYFVVACNGDGVNDLPAIKEANVGMAVKSAVDALKNGADIVLLTDGIAVIKDAITEGRKIFARLYSYSIYRISESLRLIVTITVLGLLYRSYPLVPLQLILLALLNDIPIISLAFDRVRVTSRPAKINVRERFLLSLLLGSTGIANSLILFFIMTQLVHLPWGQVQTVYFLKLTVSGHMLIYVARTRERWFKFLPARQVIWATTLTQLIATALALTGILMPSPVPLVWAAIVWGWSFLWMQISELAKVAEQKLEPPPAWVEQTSQT